MAHKTRAEQISHRVKARKDPKGKAKHTKIHVDTHPEYKRAWGRIWKLLEEVDRDTHD